MDRDERCKNLLVDSAYVTIEQKLVTIQVVITLEAIRPSPLVVRRLERNLKELKDVMFIAFREWTELMDLIPINDND